jgi:hypothetical protein
MAANRRHRVAKGNDSERILAAFEECRTFRCKEEYSAPPSESSMASATLVRKERAGEGDTVSECRPCGNDCIYQHLRSDP